MYLVSISEVIRSVHLTDCADSSTPQAEDRILCFELVTKRNQSWLLKYVKSAKAETDVPDKVDEFISQRRRWLNGSFFAGFHALTHWYFIFRSGHNILRKMLLCLLFLYNFIQLAFSWFGLSFFYLTFYFLLSSQFGTGTQVSPFGGSKIQQGVADVSVQIYFMALVMTFISSLGNRPQGTKILYILIITIYAIIMGFMIYICGWDIYQALPKTDKEWKNIIHTDYKDINASLKDIVMSLASTYGLYLVASIMYLEPWHMMTSFLQYIFLQPSFVNILNVYAFCNLHDVSWGTKGDNNQAGSLGAVTATKGKDGKQMVEVEIPTERNDINANYDKFLHELAQPRPDLKKARDAKTKQEDLMRRLRTGVVLGWVFSNMLIVAVLTNQTLVEYVFKELNIKVHQQFNPYLKVRLGEGLEGFFCGSAPPLVPFCFSC